MINRDREPMVEGLKFYREFAAHFRYRPSKNWEAQAKRKKKKKPRDNMINMIDRSKSSQKD